jgi:hypothetical protein
MKYIKTIEIEVEITKEDIIALNDYCGTENNADYFILEDLEDLMDGATDIVNCNSFIDVPNEIREKIKMNINSGLVEIPEDYFECEKLV